MPYPEVTKLIQEQAVKNLQHIDASLENLKMAVDGCIPDFANIAVRVAQDIGRQMRTTETYMLLDDLPEEDANKINTALKVDAEKLVGIVEGFAKGCKCGSKT